MVNPIIPASFFERDPLICARELIGAELIWGNCSGVLVETEAYNAINDEACHTFMRPSTRAFIERNKAGAAYVYFNYGMHWMLNVLVKGQANGFVLIRALEPKTGIERMKKRRKLDDVKRLCSGPGKLTQPIVIMKWICAPTHGIASRRTQTRLLTLWRIRELVSDAPRIIRGVLLCAAARS